MTDAPRKEGCCELCGKPWQPEHFGSPRKCAFEGETFSDDNWNCGLANRLRREMYDKEDEPCALRWRNDDGVGSVGALVIEVPETDPNSPSDYKLAGVLIASWYKDRGRVDTLEWAFEERGTDSRELTRTHALDIVRTLDDRERRQAEAEAQQAASPQPISGLLKRLGR